MDFRYMRYFLLILGATVTIIVGGVIFYSLQAPQGITVGGNVLLPSQGGTGIASSTAGDIGKVLKVSSDSPFRYVLGTDNTGGGGGSSNFATTTDLVNNTIATIIAPNIIQSTSSNPLYIGSLNSSTTATSTFTGGAQTLGLQTGYVNATNTNGLNYFGSKVGIGYTAPTNMLDVSGSLALNTSGFLGFVGNTLVDTSNYSLFGNTTLTLLNARSGGSIGFRIANADVANFTTTGGFGFGSTFYNLDPGQNNMIIEGNLGVGTSSPGSVLSIGNTGWNFFDNGTTTSYAKGIDLLGGGCFSIGGTCLSLSTLTGILGIANGGTNANRLSSALLWFDGASVSATGTQVTVGNLVASTSATSTFVGGIETNRLRTSATSTMVGLQLTGGLKTSLASCDTLDTTASGDVVCGTDGGGTITGSGINNSLTAWTSATNIQATSTQPLYVGSLFGTTTATSTLNGGLSTLQLQTNWFTATGTATSSVTAGLSVGSLGASATSTFAGITALTGGIKISTLAGCTQALETDSNGSIVCGTDQNSGGTVTGTGINNTITTWNSITGITSTSSLPLWVGSLNATSTATSSGLLGGWSILRLLTDSVEATSSLKIPIGTGISLSVSGQLAIDTSDQGGQLVGATSTASVVFGRGQKRLYSFTVASTSLPFGGAGFTTGKTIPFPPETDGFTVNNIQCSVWGGTSIVINLTDSTGGDTNQVTCSTTSTSTVQQITTGKVFTAGEGTALETSTVTGEVNYLTVSVFGTITPE